MENEVSAILTALASVTGREEQVYRASLPAQLPDWIPLLGELSRLNVEASMLGYSFPVWRFPSIGFEGGSLLERVGLSRLRRGTDKIDGSQNPEIGDLFGAGFVEDGADHYLEFRRAYILISRKVGGERVTVAIRNNSRHFGIDRLPDAVLVSLRNFEIDGLKNLTPNDFQTQFRPLVTLYAEQSSMLPLQIVEALKRLLVIVYSFETRFDGFLRAEEGQEAILSFLEYLRSVDRRLPYIGTVSLGELPWFPRRVLNVQSLEAHEVKSALLRVVADNISGIEKIVFLSGEHGDHPK